MESDVKKGIYDRVVGLFPGHGHKIRSLICRQLHQNLYKPIGSGQNQYE